MKSHEVRDLFEGREWLGGKRSLTDRLTWLGHATFVPRGRCEADESLKQLIPYVVLRADEKIYSYARGIAGAEDRLHERRSIGIGGHINPCDDGDGGTAHTIRRAAYREFMEEVGRKGELTVRSNQFVGMVNDDSDAVGRVHVGVIMIFDLHTTDIEPREAALADGRWCTTDELQADFDRLERWSQICVENLLTKEGASL